MESVLILKAECFAKHERKNGGTILFAIDAEDSKDGTIARKTVSFQTCDLKDLQAIETGAEYTITFTK